MKEQEQRTRGTNLLAVGGLGSKNLFRIIISKTCRHLHATLCSKDGSYIMINTSTANTYNHPNAQLKKNKISALVLGKKLATRAKALGITRVLFQRSGFRYHGLIKSLAEAARNYGLNF